MRYVFIVLMCVMLLFAGVQYNDPDGLMWMIIYAVPAIWCAIGAFAQRAFEYGLTKWILAGSIAASFAGVLWFWPLTPRFWTKAVWYNVETAREGLGLMIVMGVLLLVFFGCHKSPRKPEVVAAVEQG
ncbi:MAG: transmembrane 220 family protein [Granulosicoccus sp.]